MVSPAVFTVLIGLTFIQTHLNFNSKAIGTIYYSKRGTDYTTVSVSRPRAKRFLFTRILYSSNGISTFQLERKLLVCGDIEPNPGPEKTKCKPKYPCGECGKTVKRNQDAILCARCNIWSHAICLKLPKQSLNYYQLHPEIEWICFLCSLPDLNDSFFSHDEQEVDTNFTADLSAAEKEQEDIR